MTTLIRRVPWTVQPAVLPPIAAKWRLRGEFAWLGSTISPVGFGRGVWERASTVTDAVKQYGRASIFPGGASFAAYRTGSVGSTVAQTKCTFVAIATMTGTVGAGIAYHSIASLTSHTGSNKGLYFGDSNGVGRDIGITKGGVAALSTVTVTKDVPYVFVTSHRQDTGEYYVLARSLLDNTILRSTQTSTSASTAGSGVYSVGQARTDVNAWTGDIGLAFGSFDFLPEILGLELLWNPWALFEPRRIIIPIAPAAAGGFIPAWARNSNIMIQGAPL